MQYIKLNNGVSMPILGFGVFQIEDPILCEQSVLDAIEVGYRLIDTAMIYKNEQAVGRAVSKSGIAREEFFITTKVWIKDAGYENTKKAFYHSLSQLDLNYIDLYLIHQPYGDIFGSWKALEELYTQGLIKAIGVSNFYDDRLMDFILHNQIKPAINQIETHPFYQRTDSAEFMKKHNVQMESWGPFAEGKNGLFSNPVLSEIGKKYNKSVAQTTLRWLIQRGIVAIPKSVNQSRIQENFNIFDFELSKQDMDDIATLDTHQTCFFSHHDPSMVEQLSRLS
ncbi:MAG: aldo/keto reductase [Spirochaetia bacterium]